VFLLATAGVARSDEDPLASAGDVFTQRILPILRSPSASSCTECHFAGIELRDYIVEDQAETFAALRRAGLIDVEKPDQSRILTFIGRKAETPNADLQQVREREYAAFRSWLRAAVREPQLLAARSTSAVGTELPVDVVRHARRDRVLSSFIDNIWSELGRCVNCHSPEKNRHAIKKHGQELVDAISWIVPHDPAATLERLVADGHIDFDHPEQSPVLTKPSGQADHEGGRKFLVGSPTYAQFRAFLADYAAIRTGTYQSTDDLPTPPQELVLLTEQQLRLTGLPAQFGDAVLQVDLHRWNPQTQTWSEDRWGTAYNAVHAARQIWQSPVSVVVPVDSPHRDQMRKHPHLPDGAYLVKLSLVRGEGDPTGRAAVAPASLGYVEISGEWPPGYQPPKIVDFANVRRIADK
jgi:hypothetical protein